MPDIAIRRFAAGWSVAYLTEKAKEFQDSLDVRQFALTILDMMAAACDAGLTIQVTKGGV